MTDIRTRRVQKELLQLQNLPDGIKWCKPDEHDVFQWTACIEGPTGGNYEGGIFGMKIVFGKDYPFKAPQVTFTTRIYHMNVSSCGMICLDLLKEKWSPSYTMESLLVAIVSLLNDPNPDDPLVPSIAALFETNRERHDFIAKKWTQKYAK